MGEKERGRGSASKTLQSWHGHPSAALSWQYSHWTRCGEYFGGAGVAQRAELMGGGFMLGGSLRAWKQEQEPWLCTLQGSSVCAFPAAGTQQVPLMPWKWWMMTRWTWTSWQPWSDTLCWKRRYGGTELGQCLSWQGLRLLTQKF